MPMSAMPRQVKAMVKEEKAEMRHVTTAWSSAPLDTVTGTFVLLNGTTQGDAETQRSGSRLSCVTLNIRHNIYNAGNATSAPAFGRIIVFWDKRANGAAPLITDLLEGTVAVPAPNALSSLNFLNRDRFKILTDQMVNVGGSDTITLTATGVTAVNFIGHDRHMVFPLKGHLSILNNGSTGSVADILSGSLYYFYIPNIVSPSGTIAIVAFQGTAQLRYEP